MGETSSYFPCGSTNDRFHCSVETTDRQMHSVNMGVGWENSSKYWRFDHLWGHSSFCFFPYKKTFLHGHIYLWIVWHNLVFVLTILKVY